MQIRRMIAELRLECLPLLEHLKALGHFQWIPNPGNAGDGLITAGTRMLFEQSGLDYHQTSRFCVEPGIPIVYGGGGGWCKAFDIGAVIVSEVANKAGSVIVLPSTFEAERLQQIAHLPHLYLYGRDHHSVKIATQLNLECSYAPDLAFFCPLPVIPQCGGKGTLAAFRKDVIGTTHAPSVKTLQADTWVDLSRKGDHNSRDRLLTKVCQYDCVHTDRLHVAIAATISGCDTYIYPNGDRYHKNLELYRSTLSKFRNCQLVNPE
ncbi:polysaccharide pyruvyl transferase family protein [Rubinisphaera italica]|nr:polysaccharide pyruvyl transferase family protein [Rubinisphaera italica]